MNRGPVPVPYRAAGTLCLLPMHQSDAERNESEDRLKRQIGEGGNTCTCCELAEIMAGGTVTHCKVKRYHK